jgi:DhnA family fructose-bisphosphate aldolase class Ia
MSAEIGADVVKCVWPGSRDAYAEVVANTTVPVVLAGGSAGDDRIEETLTLAHDAVAAGGAGVMFGRRIYSSAHPDAVLEGIRMIVHGGAAPADALALVRPKLGA